MNDRFKFRVWITYANLYYQIDSFYYDKFKRKYTFHFEDGHTKSISEKDCVIEQCTGLKDKNGKLIYEGDIIQLTRERRWLPKGSLHIIDWRTFNCCGFCLGCLGSLTEKCSKECIVIGNIHENHELLKG